MTKRVWPDGTETNFSYDGLSRLVERRFSDGRTDLYAFDEVGNLLRAGNGNSLESYVYDRLNRRISVLNETLAKEIHYSYDEMGNRTYMSSPKARGTGTRYGYDLLGNLTTATFPEGPNAENRFSYDALGRRTGKFLVNGVSSFTEYDADGRVSEIRHFSADDVEFLRFAYLHDGAGNPIGIFREDGREDAMEYDALDRLVSHTRSGRTVSFSYAAVGNRTREATAEGSVSYRYNAANQLLSKGSERYGYDLRGNRAWKSDDSGVTSYAYNLANQLTGVTLPDGTDYGFSFDALDRRVYKEYSVNDTRVANRILYDRRQPLYELNEELAPLAIYDSLPHRGLPYGELVRRKFYGYKGRGDSGGKQTIGNTHFFHQDSLGSTWKMTNHQGVEIFAYDYGAFGELESSEFTEPYNRMLFTGKEFDFATGLTHMDARAYDAKTGGWLQRDPMRLASLQLPSQARGIVNLAGMSASDLLLDVGEQGGYAYVGNNPFRFVDLTGLGKFGLVIRIGKWGLKKIRSLTKDEAKFLYRKRNKDIVASKNEMKKLSKKKGRQKPSTETHGLGNEHYHPSERTKFFPDGSSAKGGHGFIDKANVIILGSSLGVDIFGDNLIGKSIDFFNPLGDIQDILNLTNEFIQGNGKANCNL